SPAVTTPAAGATPSAAPSTSRTPTLSRATEAVLIADPDLALDLPPGWRSMPVDEIRAQVDQQMTVATPSAKLSYTEILRQIEAGDVRGGAIGPSGLAPWQGTMVI